MPSRRAKCTFRLIMSTSDTILKANPNAIANNLNQQKIWLSQVKIDEICFLRKYGLSKRDPIASAPSTVRHSFSESEELKSKSKRMVRKYRNKRLPFRCDGVKEHTVAKAPLDQK